jgi:triosephosphate isomerase
MEGQRKLFVGGNWKSNLTQAKVKELLDNTINKLNFDENKVGTPSIYLSHL